MTTMSFNLVHKLLAFHHHSLLVTLTCFHFTMDGRFYAALLKVKSSIVALQEINDPSFHAHPDSGSESQKVFIRVIHFFFTLTATANTTFEPQTKQLLLKAFCNWLQIRSSTMF